MSERVSGFYSPGQPEHAVCVDQDKHERRGQRITMAKASEADGLTSGDRVTFIIEDKRATDVRPVGTSHLAIESPQLSGLEDGQPGDGSFHV